MHGEPAGGGNLWVRNRNIRFWCPAPQGRMLTGLGVDTHPREVGNRYLLHSGTEDVIALVVGNLD